MNLLPKIAYCAALLCALSGFDFTSSITTRDGLAAPPDLVIEVYPATLELGAGEIGQVQIVVRNPTDQIASNLTLSWVNNTSVAISSRNETDSDLPPTIAELSPNAEIVWDLEVSQKDRALDAGKIYLRLDYTWIDGSLPESKPVSRLQFSEFQVTTPAVESVANVAGVEVKSTLTTLNEQRPGFVNLILENKSDVPIHIRTIHPDVPSFIKVDSPDKVDDLTLLPHEQQNIPYRVRVTDVVQPNKYVLLFEISLDWEKGGQVQVGTLIASHEIDVGVFGESQILTLLGIPAFFLLPGFLMIVAFRMLWARGKTSEEAAEFPLPAASSEFWFVAISVSLLIAILYPVITTPLLGTRRNYLEAYGLIDVFYLWFGSIVLAALTFVSYYGIESLISRFRQQQLRLKTPLETDTPILVLQKLARQKLTMRRDRALININGKEYWTFLLEDKKEEAQAGYWVAPRIHITNRAQIEDLQETIYQLLEKGTDPESFLELSPKLTLAWEREWSERGPFRAEKANIVKFGLPDVIVEFD